MAKRKADDLTFKETDDNGDGGSVTDNGADSNDDDNDSGVAAKTPVANTTPLKSKQKTPGSSPGMAMRSGRKKKRAKASFTPLKSNGEASTTKKQRGAASDSESEEEDEDEEMDTENNDENKAGYEMVGIETTSDSTTATVRKVQIASYTATGTLRKVPPPQTTREAVAAAQVTESTVEDEGEDATATTDVAATVTAASANNNAPSNGSNGNGANPILRLVSQTLRLPSQHTPKPPAPSSATAEQEETETPAPPPPGGRRLLFESDKKNAAGAGVTAAAGGGGGRNKLLMQTRQQLPSQSQGGRPQSIQKEHFPQTQQRSGVTISHATARSSADNDASDAVVTVAIKSSDVVLYTKSWFSLLLVCFIVGNVATILTTGGLTTNDNSLQEGKGTVFALWNVKELSAKCIEWYGIVDPVDSSSLTNDDVDATSNMATYEEEEEEEEEEEDVAPEIITNVVTVTNPNLLSAAHAKLRAHRMNLHDITKLEMNVKDLTEGLDVLQGSFDGWRKEYSDLDFGDGKGGEGGNDLKEMVENEISSSDVVIFSKSYCPHCKATKRLFQNYNNNNIPYSIKVMELDLLPNGQEIQSILLELTGQKTVPNVFVKGRHVGGNDDVQSMAKSDGKLEEMLALPMLQKETLDSMKSNIATKKNELLEWEQALVGVERALDFLDKGMVGSKEVNEAMYALSRVSMVPTSEAMVLDVDKIHLPGEGCEGMDYTPFRQQELENEEVEGEEAPKEEEDIVEVVGGIDVDALELAGDAPVRFEDAETVYHSLLKLAQSTGEALVGALTANNNGPYSSHAKQWVQQIIQEELQKKEVHEKPPSVDELHKPIVINTPAMAKVSFSTNDAGYTAKDAVRDIDRLLEKEDADRTGKFDYASVVHGAQVLRRGPYATSYSLYEMLPLLNRFLAYTKLRFYGHPPEVALRPTFPMHARGQCWSFTNEFSSARSARRPGMADDMIGEYATLTVSLSSAITVSEVMVEHISQMVSSNPSTAMKEFRVLGFEDGGAFAEPWELGTYKFLVGPSMQAFSIPTMLDGQNVPKLKSISIAVDSNWGGDYTCLYRVRVHGA